MVYTNHENNIIFIRVFHPTCLDSMVLLCYNDFCIKNGRETTRVIRNMYWLGFTLQPPDHDTYHTYVYIYIYASFSDAHQPINLYIYIYI